MENHNHIDELLAKHFAHETLTIDQQTELSRWIESNSEEYRRLQEIIDMPVLPQIPFNVDTEKAWNKIEPQLKPRRNKIGIGLHNRFRQYSIAASVALILAFTVWYILRDTDSQTILYADITQTENILLPDGSEVTLYPNATLAFRYADDGIARQVELKGKAFFNVKNRDNAPFKITAGQVTVEVLGTSFLVDAIRDNKSGVFVKSGRVKVSTSYNNVILEANEKVEIYDDKMTLGIIENPLEFFGDEESTLTFRNTPIAEVVREIERQTGIKIELGKGLEKNSVTTKINTKEKESIAAELAFLCGCRCDTLKPGKHYQLYNE